MSEKEQGNSIWTSELVVRLGSQAAILVLGLAISYIGALGVGFLGCICGLLSIRDGRRPGTQVE